MKSLRITTSTLLLSAALLGATMFGARADDYQFGHTGSNDILGGYAAQLTVDYANGTTDVFDTSQGEFNPGTYNQGWWSNSDSNATSGDNYFVGVLGKQSYHDFFTFDLANLNTGTTVVDATLSVLQGDNKSTTGKSFETYRLGSVSTDPATLNTHTTSPDIGIYNDLASGTEYGTYQVPVTNSLSLAVLNFQLNNNAVTDINNAAGNYFSIGGTLLFTGAPVPEASTLLSFGGLLAVGGLAALRRRRVR